MNKQSSLEKRNPEKRRIFSLGRGFRFFLKANILLVLFILVFMVNKTEWKYDGRISVITFTTFAEAFIILLCMIACIKPNRNNRSKSISRKQPKEWLGALIAFVFLSLFSLIFLGANIPYPSTLIFLMLISNGMFAAYSVLFHPIALRIYETNVFQEKTTLLDYIFKYVAIFFSGINYYVQITLLKLPLLLNKLIAIVFVLFLWWQAAITGMIFNH